MTANKKIDGLYEELVAKPGSLVKRYCSKENGVIIGTVRRIRQQLYFAAEIQRRVWPFTKDKVYWQAC